MYDQNTNITRLDSYQLITLWALGVINGRVSTRLQLISIQWENLNFFATNIVISTCESNKYKHLKQLRIKSDSVELIKRGKNWTLEEC